MRLHRFTASAALLVALAPAPAEQPGMVFIPGGEFQRGRTHALPDDGQKWFPTLLKDDRPVRGITLDPFYLDAHEVTSAQYAKFAAATGRKPPFYWPEGRPEPGKENHPVANVSWQDAAAYCAWAGGRLPAEAEWERAARGLAEGAKYPWGEAEPTDKLARFNRLDGPGDVCQFPNNYFGLCDMAGNVWEWTADWYEREYYAGAPERNPKGPAQGQYRVLRGGSWADVEKYLTCAYRSFARPGERSPNIGFRCAKDFR
jgi:formylglycine-generating enzyme required for sulfatase activity